MTNGYDKTFFDETINRRGTNCYKWDRLDAQEGAQLLPMWVADMDFRCAREITDAVMNRARHSVYGYTEQSDCAVEAMLDYYRRCHGEMLTAEDQLLLPGVVPGLRAAVEALSAPGDGVLVQPPVYGPFYDAVTRHHRRVVLNPLVADANGHYRMDLSGMEAAFQDGVKLALLCNPHNPVARAWTRTELEGMYALCKRYGVTIVVDEIHQDFVYTPSVFCSALKLDESPEANVIVMTSAGKTFNLAGLQQGVMLTRNPRLKQTVSDTLQRNGVAAGNIFALTATEAAYRLGEPWLNALLAYLSEGHRLLKTELAARLPEAVMTSQEATFLAWIDLRAYGMTTDEMMQKTHEQGVALSPGTYFGPKTGEGHLRFNFGCPHSQTLEAVKRLEKAIKG